MPYIDRRARPHWDEMIDVFEEGLIETPGDLNYIITRICKIYERHHDSPAYTVKNAIIGVLECAKLEFYRRLVVPYEDTKINQNGDVK